MGKQPAAVIGVGQTHHRAKREDVSMAGLCREAIDRALEDAGMALDEIDAIVVGKAPGPVRGRDDARAVPGRRARRGRQAAAARAHRRLGRRLDRDRRLLAGPGRACTRRCSPSPTRSSRSPTRCGRCRCRSRSTCRCTPAPAATSRRTCAPTSGVPARPTHIGAIVAAKDRQNALKNPYAHLQQPGHHRRVGAGLADAVGPDPLRRDLPVLRRRLRAGDRRPRTRPRGRRTRPGSTAP